MTAVLKVSALEKVLGDYRLGPLDLEIQAGSVLGLIGANGAGKSTTIRCLLGILRPERGSVSICGEPTSMANPLWKRHIGFVLNQSGFYEHLSVRENLKFFASFYPNWDGAYCDQLLKRLDLNPKKKVSSLSTGDLAKLAIIVAMSHRPKLLIMDEPSSGLDPLARAEFIDIIMEHMSSGEPAMLITSHIISDLAALADELAFIAKGRMISASSKDHLQERWRRIRFRNRAGDGALIGVVEAKREGNLYLVTSEDADSTLQDLRRSGAEILDTCRLSLEEITLSILKRARQ